MIPSIANSLRHGLTACAFAVALTTAANAATPEQEIAAAKVAIDAANSDWLPAVRAGDAKRIAEPYAEDGMFIAPDGEVIKGRGAIESMMADYLATAGKVVSATIRSDGVQYAGGSVVEWGHGNLSREDKNGRVTSSTSHYVTVWKRDAQGVWRIQRNILL